MRARCLTVLALAPALMTLTGCGALTAGQISQDAMRACPLTRELQFDATLLASRVRVACFSAPDRLPRPPGSTE